MSLSGFTYFQFIFDSDNIISTSAGGGGHHRHLKNLKYNINIIITKDKHNQYNIITNQGINQRNPTNAAEMLAELLQINNVKN